MNKYKIQFDKRYFKELEKIPPLFRPYIREKIESLSNNPRPEESVKLSGSKKPLYRIRCGNYRILYTIEDDILVVVVVQLGHRKDIYRQL